MKKLLTLALAVLFMMSAISFAACAPTEQKLEPPKDVVTTDYLEFTLNKTSKTYSVKPTDAGKELSELTIPGKINGYTVISIADYAFIRNTNLVSVTIGEGLATIGISAFLGCSNIETMSLPESLVQIKQNAFDGCAKIQKLKLSDKIRLLGNSAFANCTSLKSINIPSTLVSIPNDLFSNCDLQSVTLPETIKKIGSSAFQGNINLTEVNLNNALEEIGYSAFSNCTSLTEILFPRNKSLTLGDYAFSQSGLLKVYIPSNVILGTYTFEKLAWDNTIENPGDPGNSGASKCTAIYYESMTGSRGINTFGYTWNRPDLGFNIYVPAGSLEYYNSENPGDEAWTRCVVTSVNSHNGEFPVLKEYDINEVFPDGFPCC